MKCDNKINQIGLNNYKGSTELNISMRIYANRRGILN